MSKQIESDLETLKHIQLVRDKLSVLIEELIERSNNHDKSKLESPEREIFAEHFGELEKVEYGTPEYSDLLKKVQPAIDHHYNCNRHHPNFHKNGVNGMDIIDIVEMLVDWLASSSRNKNGNVRKSIEINSERFGIGEQLKSILENTINRYF